MLRLAPLRVAIITTDGFEEAELLEPMEALQLAGAQVEIISLRPGKIHGFRHQSPSIQIDVDRVIGEVQPGEYHALVLPGGMFNADAIRDNMRVQFFVRAMHDAGRPIATLSYAPWILISSDAIGGQTLTSYPSIRYDVRNAGGNWVDSATMLDGNLVSCRGTGDIHEFNQNMLRLFARAAAEVRSPNTGLAEAA